MVEPLNLFDGTFNSLEQAMQVTSLRQGVIAQNIANANTPGYEALKFDDQLMKAVTREEKRQVVLEQEMSDLTENSVRYSAYVKMLSSKLNMLKTIASQGRR
jgi:flagellar basal body rod protein FlgB